MDVDELFPGDGGPSALAVMGLAERAGMKGRSLCPREVESVLRPVRGGGPAITAPYLTAKDAAAYLKLSYSTFRKRALRIRRVPQTGRYRREDLDAYAESLRPRKQR